MADVGQVSSGAEKTAKADHGLSGAMTSTAPKSRPGLSGVEAEHLAVAIWQACAVSLVLVDETGSIREANRTFAEVVGLSPTALVGRAAWDFMPAEVGLAALAGVEAGAARELQVSEHVLTDRLGNRRRLAWSLARVQAGSGHEGLILATGIDVTPERVVQETLREQAERDELTGLSNRSFLRRALTACLGPFRGAGGSLLFLDLDGFKQVNDKNGHATGDMVLKEVARRLVRMVRPEDVVARFGGDEFVILLPAAGPNEAQALATRAERAVTRPMRGHDRLVRVGVSIGVRVAHIGQDVDHVLRDADAAMYATKQAHRRAQVDRPQEPSDAESMRKTDLRPGTD